MKPHRLIYAGIVAALLLATYAWAGTLGGGQMYVGPYAGLPTCDTHTAQPFAIVTDVSDVTQCQNDTVPTLGGSTHCMVTCSGITSQWIGFGGSPQGNDIDWGTSPVPIASGGTNAGTAAAARTNLGTHYMLLTGTGGSNLTGGTTVQYLSLQTNGLTAGGSTTLISSPMLLTGTIKNLSVSLNGALAAGNYVVAVDDENNGGAQALTCTITSPATTCTDVTHSYAFAAGALLEWKVTPASAATALPIRVSAEVDM